MLRLMKVIRLRFEDGDCLGYKEHVLMMMGNVVITEIFVECILDDLFQLIRQYHIVDQGERHEL